MISNVTLAYANGRLQGILANPKPFGGISVLYFGDLYKLPPVQYKPLVADLSHTTTCAHSFIPNIWKELSMFELHNHATKGR